DRPRVDARPAHLAVPLDERDAPPELRRLDRRLLPGRPRAEHDELVVRHGLTLPRAHEHEPAITAALRASTTRPPRRRTTRPPPAPRPGASPSSAPRRGSARSPARRRRASA